jgi:hypothetical protein
MALADPSGGAGASATARHSHFEPSSSSSSSSSSSLSALVTPWWLSRLLSPSSLFPLAYGGVMAASAALNTVFVLYYVELFAGSSHATLTPAWFYAGQVVFM